MTVREGRISSSTITTTPESVAKIQEAISRLPPAGAATGPDAVVKALEAAANAHDVAGATALFTDDAVIQIRPAAVGETYTGKEQIRQWFEGLYADDSRITVSVTNVQGDTVTANSTVSSNGLRGLGLTSLEGIEQYTVQNGKITRLSFTYTDDSAARVQSALTPRALPSTGAPEMPPRYGSSCSRAPASSSALLYGPSPAWRGGVAHLTSLFRSEAEETPPRRSTGASGVAGRPATAKLSPTGP